MERRQERNLREKVQYTMVKEIFVFICRCLRLQTELVNPDVNLGENRSNEALGSIGQVILVIQILLRDFFKSYFASRAREIYADLLGETLELCNAVVQRWPDGSDFDKVYVVSAMIMELYLFCGSLYIRVDDEFFPRVWYNRLAKYFGHTVQIIGGYFPTGDPLSTDYYHDYSALAELIDDLASPYQSINLSNITDVQPSYNFLTAAMSRVFNQPQLPKVGGFGLRALGLIYGNRPVSQSTSREGGPSTSREGGPSTSREGGSRRDVVSSTKSDGGSQAISVEDSSSDE